MGAAKGGALGGSAGALIDAGIHFFSERADRHGRKNPQEQMDEITEAQESLRGVGQGNRIESVRKSVQRGMKWIKENWQELLDDFDDY